MSTVELGPQDYAREATRRHLEELKRLAPTNLAAHATLFHQTSAGRPVIPARHHAEWVRFAHDVQNYRWIVIVCPPGYAKSTWWSVIYPAWRIGVTQGRIRIGLISNTANLTYGFMRSIQHTIENPLFQDVYGPNAAPDPARGWSQKQFWVKGGVDNQNPTVMAAGIGGPIQGKRYDEIICDDLTTWEDARSEGTMDGQRHFLKALLIKRFEPGGGPPNGTFGRFVVAMTRWSERDLLPTFQQLGFKIITMPAIGYWDRVVGSDGEPQWGSEPLWPEQETLEQLLIEREEDPLTFELVKQGNPSVLGGDVFDTSKLVYARMPKREEFSEIVQYVDTAGGKDRAKGDYFAIATVGVRDDQIWVLDMERGRYPAPEQERQVEFAAEKWESTLIVIEDRNEGTALFQRMAANTRLPINAYVPIRDKEWRAISFANAVRAERVHVPLEFDHKAEAWVAPRWVRSFVSELEGFPRAPHDDQVDAVVGAYNHTGGAGPKLRALTTSAAGGGGGGRTRGRRFRF